MEKSGMGFNCGCCVSISFSTFFCTSRPLPPFISIPSTSHVAVSSLLSLYPSQPLNRHHEFLSSFPSTCLIPVASAASEFAPLTTATNLRYPSPLPSPLTTSLSSPSSSLSRLSEDQLNEQVVDSLISEQQDLIKEQETDLSLREDKMLAALKERRTDEAWKAFEFLMSRGRAPNSVCLSRLVAQLSYQGTPSSLSQAQKVVANLQKQNNIAVLDCNSLGLLAMATSKAGASRYASTIIRTMLKLGFSPHVKAWSAVVSRLGKHREDVPLALKIFEDICHRVREEEAITSDSQDSDGGHEERKTYSTSMRPDTGAFNAVLNACANADLFKKAEELFDQLYTFGLTPDALTFNIMIKLYGNTENREKLAGILDQMEHAGVKPCASTMHSLVAAYVGLGELERALMLVKILKEGRDDIKSILRSDNEAVNKSKDSVEVLSLESVEMTRENEDDGQRGLLHGVDGIQRTSAACLKGEKDTKQKFRFKPDVRMYTIIMKGYMQKGRFMDVMQLLVAMQHEQDPESRPNEVTYTTAISTCVRLGLLDEARTILLEMAAQKVPANVVTYNVLLNGYCKAFQIQKARLLIEDMKKAGILPDVVSYNTLIDGCINIDDNVAALAMFKQMREAGIAPSKVSYTTLMKAFGRNGQPRLAAKVFEEMKLDTRMMVDVIAWNILIECYSKEGLVEDAKNTLKSMKENGQEPTVATYGSLVKAFSMAGKAGEVLVLWKEIQERLEAKEGDGVDPLKPDAGLLDALVDICVRAGYFQRAMEIVACMEKHQIPADKIKYKRMFVELYSKLYTSRHTSQARRDRTAERRRAVEAFKFWVGLPNNYYESSWSP